MTLESQASASVRINAFGPMSVRTSAGTYGPEQLGGNRPKQVLQILLAARGHNVPVERMADLLWGAHPPGHAAAAIHKFVSVLRGRLTPDRELARALIVTQPGAYRFATESAAIDLDEFDALLERASTEPAAAARRTVESALKLANGEVFEDEPYAAWARELRESYRERVVQAHVEAGAMAVGHDDPRTALEHADKASAIDPFNERALRTAMIALYRLGRQHAALARYRCFQARLSDELGLVPGGETRALEAAILRQADPDVTLSEFRARPGLGADAGLVGPGPELEALLDATRAGLAGGLRLVGIEGPNGAGKTRLLEELGPLVADAPLFVVSCSPLEQQLSYVPVAAALRALVGTTARLPGVLARILPELRSAQAPIADELEALETLVGLIAEQQPFVVTFDDLHFADASSIRALHYLRRRCGDVRAAVVFSFDAAAAPPGHPLRALTPDVQITLGEHGGHRQGPPNLEQADVPADLIRGNRVRRP